MLPGHLTRLSGEPPSLRDRGRAPCAPPLDQRQGTGDQRRHQRGRDGREQTAQAPGPAPCASQLSVLGVPARLQELAFDPRELPLAVRELDGGGQAGPAIEVGLLAPRLLPGAGRGRQLAFRSERFPIVRQPSAEPRPLPDQRLVGDLGGVVTHDQEAGASAPPSPSGISSASATRRRVSSVASPSSVSWSNIRRISACSSGLQPRKTSSAVWAIAPRTPPAAW